MDMWRPYRDATRAVLPQATIVVDKFHIVRMANDAVEFPRTAIRADLTTSQRRGLMHDRFVLLKRERDLTDQERLLMDGWTKNYPCSGTRTGSRKSSMGSTTTRRQATHMTPRARGSSRSRAACMRTSSR